jgi:tetratricopeptide (TPR) repeat protein
MGGSTTAGFPYGNNVMFPRILQYRLADVFPDKHIEVINVGITAVNTYTLLDFMDEILQQKPDALLIYSGHNEFYGALGAASYESLGRFRPFVKFYLRLQKTKTFLLLRNVMVGVRQWFAEALSTEQGEPTATLMERMVTDQSILLGSAVYELGRSQFQGNLRDILDRAGNAGVPVVLSELVSNIRDLKPFVSIAGDSLPAARDVYARAVESEKAGNFERARELYLRAKDLDALRFRATEDFNAVIHAIAKEYDTPVVPMKSYFEQASPNGLVGNNLMLEHLHPNKEGYFLMADAFFDTMRRAQMISARWDSTRIYTSEYYQKNWGFTELDLAYSNVRIEILKGSWPFKPKGVANQVMLAYRPTSKVDSLAYQIWRDDTVDLEHAHVAMAEDFQKQGEYLKAFEEYKALVYLTPLNDSPYLLAADMLIKARHLDRATILLEKAFQLEESAFACKWLGQIYLDQGHTGRALPYLEKAVKMAPKDPQLIYNLSGAYALSQQFDKARSYLSRLDELSPNFPGANDLKRQLERL